MNKGRQGIGPVTIGFAALCFLSSQALAQERFKTHGGFGGQTVAVPVDKDHSMGYGVARGIVYNDAGNKMMDLATAACPYTVEIVGGAATFRGICTWTERGGDKIFTTWSSTFENGKGSGPQDVTGGTGKFSGVKGKIPFQCTVLGTDQFECSQEWEITTK